VLSPDSDTIRADPAVSAATMDFSLSARMTLRHCPSAMTWLSTVSMVFRLAPGSAIN
jgi:hypothetical protein